ncbi:MAG: FkbM family methyltransferase [Dysgonomonas sp.]
MGTRTYTLPYKLIQTIINNDKVDNFVETGSYKGETTEWAATRFKNVYSIEVKQEYAKEAKQKCQQFKNVEIIEGDSRAELPKLISKLQGKTIFFLDSHSITEVIDNKYRNIDCPLTEELSAVATYGDPIVFINDVYRFMGPSPDSKIKWPAFEEIFNLCKSLFPNLYITIIDGNLVCVPQNLKNFVSAYWIETLEERFYESEPEPRKRSLIERIFSRSKRIIKKATAKKEGPVAYKIENSVWFANQCKIFAETNKWLQDEQFKSIVDVGANVGQFGKKIRIFYPEAQLYSFEPIPFVYDELKHNFEGDSRFRGFNVGLGDESGKTHFYLNDFSDSSSMLKVGDLHKKNYPFTKHEQEIEVEVKRLDECIDANKIEKPYLLKLDVQGFEKQVIAGGMETVRNAAMIITEVSYKELYEGQELFDSLYEILKKEGFRYMGNMDQMNSTINGEPLQGDAIFKKVK